MSLHVMTKGNPGAQTLGREKMLLLRYRFCVTWSLVLFLRFPCIIIGDVHKTEVSSVVAGAACATKIQINGVMKVRKQKNASRVKKKHGAERGVCMMYIEIFFSR